MGKAGAFNLIENSIQGEAAAVWRGCGIDGDVVLLVQL
jgi:hypothetical protein